MTDQQHTSFQGVKASSVDTVAPPPSLQSATDFDAIEESLLGLEGKVDKKPKMAAIILAGGSGERFGH